MVYEIEKATQIADNIYEFWINAPHIAGHGKAGQFLIIRLDESGERVPLTISAVKGDSVRIVFMAVGMFLFLIVPLTVNRIGGSMK